jgi:hypothetical protein
MLDSLSCSFTSITFLTTKVKEQRVVRKVMDVNEHERLSNITLISKLNKGTARSKKGYGCK